MLLRTKSRFLRGLAGDHVMIDLASLKTTRCNLLRWHDGIGDWHVNHECLYQRLGLSLSLLSRSNSVPRTSHGMMGTQQDLFSAETSRLAKRSSRRETNVARSGIPIPAEDRTVRRASDLRSFMPCETKSSYSSTLDHIMLR